MIIDHLFMESEFSHILYKIWNNQFNFDRFNVTLFLTT